MRVLYVDPREEVRTALSRLLERKGYTVEATDDLGRALELAPEQDVLLFSIRQPDASLAQDFIRTLRSKCAQHGRYDLPAIALSTYLMPANTEAIQRAGFHRVIAEPLGISKVHEAIQECVKERR